MKKGITAAIVAAVIAVAVVCVVSRSGEHGDVADGGTGPQQAEDRPRQGRPHPAARPVVPSRPAPVRAKSVEAEVSPGGETSPETEMEEESDSEEENRREREEEARVEDFDSLTDKWMEPSKEPVSMKDVDEFAAKFRLIPKERQEECLHRALNLVPDENVMLLAGILMDKSQDAELVELVFNDVLNRSDDVKKPILQQIFKDKEHPCWADAAWVLDMTGEAPEKKN